MLAIVGRGILRLVFVVLLAWGLLYLSPIDPVIQQLGSQALTLGSEQKQQLLHALAIEQNLWSRLHTWLLGIVQGDWGYSSLYQQPVTQVLAERLPLSLLLMLLIWIGSLLLGYCLGLLAAIYHRTWLDSGLTSVAWLLASLPSFWFGMLLISVFAVSLAWFPVCCVAEIGQSFWQQSAGLQLKHLTLPVLTLLLLSAAPLMLHTREKALSVMQSEFVQYSQLHGDHRLKILCFHLLPNAFIPALILQLTALGELLSGTLIIESLFIFPGVGQALVKAALAQDIALFMAGLLLAALLVFVGNGLATVIGRIWSRRGYQ